MKLVILVEEEVVLQSRIWMSMGEQPKAFLQPLLYDEQVCMHVSTLVLVVICCMSCPWLRLGTIYNT
jgi:hypothetical protein